MPASSSRQRRSSTTRPASMRPITGIGKPRNGARQRLDRRPDRTSTGRQRQRRRSAATTPAARRCRSGCGSRPVSTSAISGERLPHHGQQAPASAAISARGPRQQAQRRQARGEPIGIGVKPQHRFERGQPDLVEPQRALQRVSGEPCDEIGAADDEPGLRAAQQFVAAEGDEIGARRQRLGDGRLVRQAPALEIDQRAAAEILDQRHAAFARQRRELAPPAPRR